MLKTLRTFYYFVFRKKLVYTLVIVCVVATSALQSVTPYFFKLFADAIPSLNYDRLMHILLIYVGVGVLSLIVDTASGLFGDMVLLDAARDAREEIFKHVQDLDFAFHAGKSTGSLISAFKRGDGAFFDLFLTLHFNFLNIIVTTLVMIYFFSGVNFIISILMVASFVLTVIATQFLIRNNVKKNAEKFRLTLR